MAHSGDDVDVPGKLFVECGRFSRLLAVSAMLECGGSESSSRPPWASLVGVPLLRRSNECRWGWQKVVVFAVFDAEEVPSLGKALVDTKGRHPEPWRNRNPGNMKKFIIIAC